MILITGGAGFIGSNFVLHLLNDSTVPTKVVVVDCLTYAGNMNNLKSEINNPNFFFEKCKINNTLGIRDILQKYRPNAVVNFAAESHVDRSILSPSKFIETNINGTYNLLQASFDYYLTLDNKNFKFLHISTDEVYGSLDLTAPSFTEDNPYQPNSPYAASKASSDFLVRAWNKTYGFPTLITNCSNNYGPFQFPEKLIPLVILNAIDLKKIPIYGDGKQIRDWIFVTDHCEAIKEVLTNGIVGETYNIGGNCEYQNIDLVKKICHILDELSPIKNTSKKIKKYSDLIHFVQDRPGHDKRYSVNNEKIKSTLNWTPKENLTSGLRKTINWYLKNNEWINSIKNKSYQEWIKLKYGN